MQSNIQIVTYKEFLYAGKIYKNVIGVYYKDMQKQSEMHLLPRQDEPGYFSIGGTGHIRNNWRHWTHSQQLAASNA